MTIFLLILTTLIGLGYLWFRLRMRNRPAATPVIDEFEDFNEKFLRNPAGKDETIELVRVFRPDDLELLRSLLDSEGIESYAPVSNMGALYPLDTIPGFTYSVITVYAVDAEAARQIVKDYPAEGLSPPRLIS